MHLDTLYIAKRNIETSNNKRLLKNDTWLVFEHWLVVLVRC